MNASCLTVTLSHDPARLDCLQAEWTALQANSATDCIYMTWEWITIWWAHFGSQGQLWLLEAREPDGRLVGLAPLMLVRHKPLRGIVWRQLQLVGTSSPCEHLDFIIERGREGQVVPLFLDQLKAERPRWQVLSLSKLPPYSTNLDPLRASGIPWQEGEALIAPVILLPGDWDTYHNSLSKRKRKNLRRYHRQLEEAFPDGFTWKLAEDPAEVEIMLDRMIALHQARWESLGEPGGFADPTTIAFHHAIARRFLEKGWLRLACLCFGAEPAVISYFYAYQNRFYDFAYGVDFPRYGEFNVGHLSTEMALRHAIESGGREYDFLWGDEEYKFQWGAIARADLTFRWMASPRARLEQRFLEGLRAAWHQVKRFLPARWRQAVKESAGTAADDYEAD